MLVSDLQSLRSVARLDSLSCSNQLTLGASAVRVIPSADSEADRKGSRPVPLEPNRAARSEGPSADTTVRRLRRLWMYRTAQPWRGGNNANILYRTAKSPGSVSFGLPSSRNRIPFQLQERASPQRNLFSGGVVGEVIVSGFYLCPANVSSSALSSSACCPEL